MFDCSELLSKAFGAGDEGCSFRDIQDEASEQDSGSNSPSFFEEPLLK